MDKRPIVIGVKEKKLIDNICVIKKLIEIKIW